jgi:hypothetical protein
MKLGHFCFLGVALVVITASCRPSRETQIIGLWQEVSMTNPQMDQAMEEQMRFVDTVGSQTDAAANVALYGIDNMDSFKASIRTNIDSFKRAQGKAVSETWFEFQKNGMAYLHSMDGLDSANWYFEDDALILDEQKLKGGGAKIQMDVQVLNDTALQLHFTEKYLSSTASFRKVKR